MERKGERGRKEREGERKREIRLPTEEQQY